MYGYFDCIYVHCVPEEAKEGIRTIGTGVTFSRELPHECWEPNSGLLREQSVLLTTELSLQPPIIIFYL